MGCNHLWNANDGKGGAALFEVRTSGGELVMRASCSRCGTRAWFNEKDWWDALKWVKPSDNVQKPPDVPKKRGGK